VGEQIPGNFVTNPFKLWIKMSQKVNAHAALEYHLTSMAKMSEFLSHYESPSLAVNTIMDSETQKIMEDNKKVIESLLRIIMLRITMLCGKQGLASGPWSAR